MIENATELAKDSDSTIIILLVVLVILAIASIPVINTLAKIRKGKRKDEYDREIMLIQVIEKNTEVNAALKTLIEADQKHCDQCKSEQRNLFRKVFDNQEVANVKLAEIAQKLDVRKET
jgi:DNA-directed RNA polymerase specialized sigma24 family protein